MYPNKTNEELIELLEERDQSIYDLKQENSACMSESIDLNKLIVDVEESIKKSFYAGHQCAVFDVSSTILKGWLNYKIMENIS